MPTMTRGRSADRFARRAAQGGETGPAIVPGDPEKSLLIHAIRRDEGFPRMPKKRGEAARRDHRGVRRVDQAGRARGPPGRPAAAKRRAATPPRRSPPSSAPWWSFQPLAQSAPPSPISNAEWVKTDIDRLRPRAPGARRAAAGEARRSADAPPPRDAGPHRTAADARGGRTRSSPTRRRTRFAKVVDRLLASPRYGEAWGRHWLDVARYAEDDPRSLDPMQRGYNPYPNAYLYRDWVVKAFNDDMPYDRFVKAQLAADQMDEHRARAHAARARLPRASARGTTTTDRSRSRAPTSATIASTSCRAASSG